MHRHYSYYYDDRLRERAAEMYKEDIERFGYEFGAALAKSGDESESTTG